MRKHSCADARYRIPATSLVPFLVITFGLSWGILGLYILFPVPMAQRFGLLSGRHPLFFVAVWAPAIAASLIVPFITGIGGLRRFLSRALLWRAGPRWYLFLIGGLPAVFYTGAAWKGTLVTEPFPPGTFQAALVALLFAAIKGPLEELGWRGFALPLIQRMVVPFWAALTLGAVWGLWHLPAFMASGTQQSAWSFMPFFVGTIGISMIITALFNASGGSVLLAAAMHFQLMNPVWPDAQPYDTYLLTAVAAVVVWSKRKQMFGGNGAIVHVVSHGRVRGASGPNPQETKSIRAQEMR